MSNSELQQLLDNHWEYVLNVLRNEKKLQPIIILTIDDYLSIIGFHYRTAFIHGYKHGLEVKKE